VPAAFHIGIFPNALPGGLERCHVAGRIERHGPAKGKQVPLILSFAKPLLVPCTIVEKRLVELRVQRDRPALARFGLRSSNAEEF
jgi:hypothetical protein